MARPDGAPDEAGSANAKWDALYASAVEAPSSEAAAAPEPAPQDAGMTSRAAEEAAPDPAIPGDDGPEPVAAAAGTPPAEAAPSPEPTPVPEEPFTFSVDGQSQTAEGVWRVPGEGLLVEESAVPRVQQMFSRAIAYERHNRELLQQNEDLTKATAWTFKNREGKDVTLTGRDAILASRADAERTKVALQVIAERVFNPEIDLTNLLVRDEQGRISFDPQALQALQRESAMREENAIHRFRQSFGQQAPSASRTTEAPAVDYQAEAPAFIAAQLPSLGLKADALTADDIKVLGGLLPRFVRPAVEADRQVDYTIRVGQPIVDASFAEQIKDRASLRASLIQTAKATKTAAQFNGGMDAGKKQPPKPPPVPTPSPLAGRSDAPKPKRTSATDRWAQLTAEAVQAVGEQ